MKEDKPSGMLGRLFSPDGSGDKIKKLIIILGLAGIALIFLSGFFKEKDAVPVVEETKITADEYAEKLQNSLGELVSSIAGAGEAQVLVTLQNGTEYVYAKEEKQKDDLLEEKSGEDTVRKQETNDSETKYITIKDADGTQRALAVTEIQPTVKGVVVVCSGGDDPIVQQRIINAVTTALDISSKRVCVTK